jgi:HAD superfamily hydrolase (TIGR01509 family)
MTLPDPGGGDAFLLDLGNVIVEIDFDRVVDHWARAAGHDTTQLRSRFTHDEPYQRHERAEITVQDYFEGLRRSLGIALTNAQFEEGWNAVFVREIPEVVSLLPALARKVPLYVFSNTNAAHHAFFSLRFATALASFRKVYVSHEVGLRKPDVRAFATVAADMGVPPDRILFFDDLDENVRGAREAGMHAVHVSSPADFVAAVKPWLE